MDDHMLAARLDEVLARPRRVRQPSARLDGDLVARAVTVRSDLGVSLRAFAELVGVNHGTVHRWEAGANGCEERYARRYAAIVGLMERKAYGA